MDKFNLILTIAIIIGLFSTYFLIIQKPLYVDEQAHFWTISNFCRFDYTIPDFLTTIPGYHFFGGFFGYLTSCTESSIRFFSLLVSLASVFVFYSICKQMNVKHKKEKSLQFLFLPILFPFFFLIYTDVLSVLFVLSMFYFLLREDYILSGTFGLLSFIVRQNNIIWIIFCLVYILIDLKDKKTFLEKTREIFSKRFLIKAYPYLAVLLIAFIFIIKNGGVVLGDKEKHPDLFFGPMNIYTFLFFFFWIKLPENILNFKKIGSWFKRVEKKELGMIILLSLIFFTFFLMTFKIDHAYNDYGIYNYFLRNKILHFFNGSIILQSVFFLCILYSIFSLYRTKFAEKRHYLIYIFSIIFLGMSWLIENRYFLIPYIMINLFALREAKTEKTLAVWYLFGTIAY